MPKLLWEFSAHHSNAVPYKKPLAILQSGCLNAASEHSLSVSQKSRHIRASNAFMMRYAEVEALLCAAAWTVV
jgi:hypothetical protein